MDVLHYLKTRTAFIRRFYEITEPALAETKRKIHNEDRQRG